MMVNEKADILLISRKVLISQKLSESSNMALEDISNTVRER